jgi:flagellar motor switch protein FliN/FliY
MSDANESGGAAAAVSRAGFEEMAPTAACTASDVSNLGLILDVTVPVTVSIGSVRKTISEILGLAPGQVIELERAAGDPVDLFVNDRLVARGEVVVVGDRYGFRVTEITAPERPRQG